MQHTRAMTKTKERKKVPAGQVEQVEVDVAPVTAEYVPKRKNAGGGASKTQEGRLVRWVGEKTQENNARPNQPIDIWT